MDKVKIKGIHHVAIKAKGIDEFRKTVEFYSDILNMPIARRWGEGENQGVMVDTGAGYLEIFANGNEIPKTSLLRHIAFEVESTDACAEKVAKAGYEITMQPKDIVIASNPPLPARIAFCIGPVGEEVEFFEFK